MHRTIELILPPPAPHMVGDGFLVHNFFPLGIGRQNRLSPFIMLDYGARTHLEPSPHQRGVGVHPHRGFETVTVVFEGHLAHHDSAGNAGNIGPGDVQWMTAGSGILHKEYHEKEFGLRGGALHMAQLWVNLPAAHKMSPPAYQDLRNTSIPCIDLPFDAGQLRIIAGRFDRTNGAAHTHSPLQLWDVALLGHASFEHSLPATYNLALLVVEGALLCEGKRIAADHLLLFHNDGDRFRIEADAGARFLLLAGEPISEPMVQYGPFVMNTRDEIRQAYEDYAQGKFGVLAD